MFFKCIFNAIWIVSRVCACIFVAVQYCEYWVSVWQWNEMKWEAIKEGWNESKFVWNMRVAATMCISISLWFLTRTVYRLCSGVSNSGCAACYFHVWASNTRGRVSQHYSAYCTSCRNVLLLVQGIHRDRTNLYAVKIFRFSNEIKFGRNETKHSQN